MRAELRRHPLETARLVLAPVEPGDAGALWAALDASRPELERWLPTAPFNTDVDSTRRYASASAVDWDLGRAFRLAIRDRTTGVLLGVVGVEGFSPLQRSVELGYWLRSDATGRGVVTEACRALIDWAFARLHVRRVVAASATDNHASLAVLRRLGFRSEGVAREVEECQGRRLDHERFGLLATDTRPW